MLSSSPLIQISRFDSQNKTSQRDLDEMNQLSGPPAVLKRPKTRLDRCALPQFVRRWINPDLTTIAFVCWQLQRDWKCVCSFYSVISYHVFTTNANDPSPWHHESQCNNLHVMQSLSFVGSASSNQAANFTSTSAKAASGISSKTCLEQVVSKNRHVFLGQHHGLLDSFQGLPITTPNFILPLEMELYGLTSAL